MKLNNEKYVVAIAYNDYQKGIGGVDKAVIAQKEKLKRNNISYLFLFPQIARIKHKYIFAHLWEVIADDVNCGLYTTIQILKELQQIQNLGKQLQGICIHHLLNIYWNDFYLLLNYTEGKITFFIHDYYTVCPQCFFMKNNETFCGTKGYEEKKCKTCRYYPAIKEHITIMNKFFQKYKERMEIIFPSESAKWIWLNQYRIDKTRIVPHLYLEGEYKENFEQIQENEKIKIAYIGQQLYLKGWNEWKSVWSNVTNKEDYCAFYFGSGKDCSASDKNVEVSFQEQGKDAMMNALREEKIHCVVLWSRCPETYSYTYYECLAANVFVITNPDSGNIAAMVREKENGIILKDEIELERLLEDSTKLKEKINNWRNQKSYGPQFMMGNRTLFEIGTNEERIKEKKLPKENIVKKLYMKQMILIVKQIKKIIIKKYY